MTKNYKHTMATLLTEWTNRQGGPLYKKLNILNNRLFDDPHDAELLCAALDDPRANELDDEPDTWCSDWADPAWYTIAWTLNRANSKAALKVIRSKGLPKLKDRLEFVLSSSARWGPISDREGTENRCLYGESSHFLVLLGLLAINSDDDFIDLAVRAARHSRLADGGDPSRTLGSWPSVFGCFQSNDYDELKLLERLRKPLPTGNAAEGYLAFANRLAKAGRVVDGHPFNTPDGLQLLLQMSDEEEGDDDFVSTTAILVQ